MERCMMPETRMPVTYAWCAETRRATQTGRAALDAARGALVASAARGGLLAGGGRGGAPRFTRPPAPLRLPRGEQDVQGLVSAELHRLLRVARAEERDDRAAPLPRRPPQRLDVARPHAHVRLLVRLAARGESQRGARIELVLLQQHVAPRALAHARRR